MAMREPVAMDFMGVGPAPGSSGGSRRSSDDEDAATAAGSSESGCLVRPIPKGSHAWRSSLEAASGVTHPFASSGSNLHGLRKQPWNRRFKAEEEHFGGTTVVSPKRERASPDAVRHAQAHHPQDNSAPASPSHQYPGEFWRMHQLQGRNVRPMSAGHQQAASRQQAGAQRTSPFRDDASQRGALPGPEHPPQPPSSQGGFGSPTPFHYQPNGTAGANAAAAMAMAKQRASFRKIPFQPGNLSNQAVARSAPGGGKLQPSTAQLTIFYAGIVNVYDDVPFDKAQTIMLLAGSSNSWSPNFMNPLVASGGAPGRNPFRKSPMPVPHSRSSSPGLPVASPPRVPTTAGYPPRSGVVFSNVRQPPATNVELPQARKASLARFLEKRKDRVRRAPVNEEGEAASASASRDKSPDPAPAVSKLASRSPSPAPAVQDQLRASLAAAMQDQHRASPASSSVQPRRDPPPSCSEPSSPPTKPPSTPPRQNLLDSEKRSPTPKRRSNADQATTTTLPQSKSSKRARTARNPHRLPDPDDSSL